MQTIALRIRDRMGFFIFRTTAELASAGGDIFLTGNGDVWNEAEWQCFHSDKVSTGKKC